MGTGIYRLIHLFTFTVEREKKICNANATTLNKVLIQKDRNPHTVILVLSKTS